VSKDEVYLILMGPNKKSGEEGSDMLFTAAPDQPFWKDLNVGGIWIEYSDSHPGTAFYLRRGEQLPEDIHKVGRVTIYHTLYDSEPLSLRAIKTFKPGEIVLPKEAFSDTPTPQSVEEWVASLHLKNIVGLADSLQLNPYPHPALDKDHLYAATANFENWPGFVTEGDAENHPLNAQGYSLEHEDKPGVYVFYPLTEELPKPGKNGGF
jgi:hypothetical protein